MYVNCYRREIFSSSTSYGSHPGIQLGIELNLKTSWVLLSLDTHGTGARDVIYTPQLNPANSLSIGSNRYIMFPLCSVRPLKKTKQLFSVISSWIHHYLTQLESVRMFNINCFKQW